MRHLLIVHFRKLAKFRYKFGCRLRLQLSLKKLTSLPARLDWAYCAYAFWVWRFLLFFFFSMRINSNSTVLARGFTVQEKDCTIHRTYNHFILKKILKMGPTSLFTHLKIILQQCFQFLVFCKICCIRTDPTYFENQTIDCIFFTFLAHMLGFVLIGYYLLYDA